MFFRIHAFQGPSFSESRFYRVWVQGPGPGPDLGPGSAIWNSKFFNQIKKNLLQSRNFFCFWKQTYINTEMRKQLFK